MDYHSICSVQPPTPQHCSDLLSVQGFCPCSWTIQLILFFLLFVNQLRGTRSAQIRANLRTLKEQQSVSEFSQLGSDQIRLGMFFQRVNNRFFLPVLNINPSSNTPPSALVTIILLTHAWMCICDAASQFTPNDYTRDPIWHVLGPAVIRILFLLLYLFCLIARSAPCTSVVYKYHVGSKAEEVGVIGWWWRCPLIPDTRWIHWPRDWHGRMIDGRQLHRRERFLTGDILTKYGTKSLLL